MPAPTAPDVQIKQASFGGPPVRAVRDNLLDSLRPIDITPYMKQGTLSFNSSTARWFLLRLPTREGGRSCRAWLRNGIELLASYLPYFPSPDGSVPAFRPLTLRLFAAKPSGDIYAVEGTDSTSLPSLLPSFS